MNVYKVEAEALCKLSQKNHKITKKTQFIYVCRKYVNVNSQICERGEIWECSIVGLLSILVLALLLVVIVLFIDIMLHCLLLSLLVTATLLVSKFSGLLEQRGLVVLASSRYGSRGGGGVMVARVR